MNETERGPSWYDAAKAVRDLAVEWSCSAEVRIVPHWRVDAPGVFGGWVVGISLTPRQGAGKASYNALCSFGAKGDRATAPGAILVCTTRLWAQLEEARQLAETQAAF